MHHLATLSALLVMPTHTGTEALGMILRWFHFLAGITWIGLLYFFNLINAPFMKQVDAGMKPKVFQHMTLPALQWFRWSALLTVFFGFWYWAQIYVAGDAERMGVSPWSTIGLFLLIWIVVWGILYAIIAKMKPSGYVLFAITTVVVIAAAWLFVNYTPVGPKDSKNIELDPLLIGRPPNRVIQEILTGVGNEIAGCVIRHQIQAKRSPYQGFPELGKAYFNLPSSDLPIACYDQLQDG